MWDAFFMLRMHTGIGYFFGTVFLFVTELDYIREDRHVNIGISALLQFSYLVAASFFAFESVAIALLARGNLHSFELLKLLLAVLV